MVEVYDDFISTEYFDQLQNFVTSPYQTWYYQNNIDSNNLLNQGLGKHGFNFWVVNSPNNFTDNYVSGMLNTLLMEMKKVTGCKNILRSRLDMTLHKHGDTKCSPHVDNNNPHISTIFYFNNSDGNTVIYNENFYGGDDVDSSRMIQENNAKLTIRKEIEPRENRLVVFDGLHIHSGHFPSKHNTRIILNSNFN